MTPRSQLRNGGTATWAQRHRPTCDRTPRLRADQHKYGRGAVRMTIATCVRGGVTLAELSWMGGER